MADSTELKSMADANIDFINSHVLLEKQIGEIDDFLNKLELSKREIIKKIWEARDKKRLFRLEMTKNTKEGSKKIIEMQKAMFNYQNRNPLSIGEDLGDIINE